MAEIEVDTKEFVRFASEFVSKYPQHIVEAATEAMVEITDYLLGKIPEYPMPPENISADGVSFLRTDAQRRWFFAAVKRGDLRGWRWVEEVKGTYFTQDPRGSGTYSYKDVPHKFTIEPAHVEKIGSGRTGNLGRSQGRDVYPEEYSVTGVIGFDDAIAPYAPWVVGEDYPGEDINGVMMYQAQIHKDRWWQFGSIIRENIGEAWIIFEDLMRNKILQMIEKG